MSDSDSFINEVTEEVRREQLFGYVRRYGWIAVLAILLLVGGAAWNEWRKATAMAQAQGVGDALMEALSVDDAQSRVDAVAAVQADGPAAAVVALVTSATQYEAGDTAAAQATLATLPSDATVPDIYHDLAAFKSAMLTEDPQDKATALEALSQPGAPFRLLAIEQQALLALEAQDIETATAHYLAILEDAEVTRGLTSRAETVLISLGQTVPSLAGQ